MSEIRHLAEAITCHAWNKDKSKVAICPNNNEVWIYTNCHQPASQWRKEAVLTEVCKLHFYSFIDGIKNNNDMHIARYAYKWIGLVSCS